VQPTRLPPTHDGATKDRGEPTTNDGDERVQRPDDTRRSTPQLWSDRRRVASQSPPAASQGQRTAHPKRSAVRATSWPAHPAPTVGTVRCHSPRLRPRVPPTTERRIVRSESPAPAHLRSLHGLAAGPGNRAVFDRRKLLSIHPASTARHTCGTIRKATARYLAHAYSTQGEWECLRHADGSGR